jgi:hypothetical protein
MKQLIFVTIMLALSGLAQSGDTVPVPRLPTMAETIGCNLMVRSALPPELKSLDLTKVESVTCECVEEKMRGDVVMTTLFGKDLEAKKKLVFRQNFQRYMIAKGMSYTFACLAPALSELADETFK